MVDYPERVFIGTVGNDLVVRLYSDGEIGIIIKQEIAEPEAHSYFRPQEARELAAFLNTLADKAEGKAE